MTKVSVDDANTDLLVESDQRVAPLAENPSHPTRSMVMIDAKPLDPLARSATADGADTSLPVKHGLVLGPVESVSLLEVGSVRGIGITRLALGNTISPPPGGSGFGLSLSSLLITQLRSSVSVGRSACGRAMSSLSVVVARAKTKGLHWIIAVGDGADSHNVILPGVQVTLAT